MTPEQLRQAAAQLIEVARVLDWECEWKLGWDPQSRQSFTRAEEAGRRVLLELKEQ